MQTTSGANKLKMELKRIINTSVAVRVTQLVLLVVAVLLLMFEVWEMVYVRRIVVQEMDQQTTIALEGAVKVIDKHVSNVESSVNTAASYAYMFAPHETLAYTFLESLIEGNVDIAAVTLLYKGNYFPVQGRYFAPTISRDPKTLKLERYDLCESENHFKYLETDSNWVYSNKLDGPYWCLPFVDSMKTDRTFITYSVPLHDVRGSTYAVLCAAVDLEWIQSVVESSKPFTFSYVSLLSRDGKYLYHPDPKYILTHKVLDVARQTNNAEEYELMKKMLDGQKGHMMVKASSTPLADSKELTGDYAVYYAPIERVKWGIAYTFPKDEILKDPNKLIRNMLFLVLLLLFLIFVIVFMVIRSQLKPLSALADSTRDIAKGNFNVSLPEIKTEDEIRYLRDSFADMQTSLAKYVDELQHTAASKASLESELKVASNIQKSMLPSEVQADEKHDDVDVFGMLKPAKEVGGDFYDFYVRDEKLLFCIGDVSGKGVPAALVMAVIRSLFRNLSAHESNPSRIVSAINETMASQNRSNMFATLFVGVFDLPTGRLHYCNAGHNSPLIIGQSTEKLPVDSNVPVGVSPDWKFTEQDALIDPGHTLFLYTDGLTEAEDSENRQFGEKRVEEMANKLADKLAQASADSAHHHAETIVKAFADGVNDFVGGATQSDDLTLLAIEYTKKQKDVILKRSITLPNDVNEIPQLNVFIDGICESLELDASTTMQLNLAVEEAVVNVMKYAYPLGFNGEVIVEGQADDSELKIIISDQGAPFDPTAKTDADITLSAEDRPIGGLGIFLVRQYMDSINYERVDGTNVLTLLKSLNK